MGLGLSSPSKAAWPLTTQNELTRLKGSPGFGGGGARGSFAAAVGTTGAIRAVSCVRATPVTSSSHRLSV